MQNERRYQVIIVGLIFCLLITITGTTVAAILPFAEVEPGMKGIGKTVFKGTRVEEFPVEVVSTITNRGLDQNSILVKVGGDKINKIGGIAAGMSGSPVYIEDKLMGAISYGWQDSDHRYCLVTPITSMLDLLEDPGESVVNRQPQGDIGTKTEFLNTPLMVSGLSGRALSRFKRDLEQLGLAGNNKVIPASTLKKDQADITSLQPGSSVAVQLVRGDINVASLGTLTYIKNDKILAFGHPFTNKGEVDFLLSRAYINGIIPSQSQPFKIGASLDELLGKIDVDRQSGLAGKLKKFPSIIPLKIKVNDKKRGLTEQISVQIIKDERFLTSLASNVALQAVDSTIDRIGRGSAQTTVKIMGSGLPDLEVKKTNMFYSRRDIGSAALVDFYRMLQLINRNPFKEVNIIDIQLNIDINKKNQVALVQEAEVLNEEVYPGDTLNFEVTLHPYRAKSFTKKVSLKLPEDINSGRTSIVVSGGYTGTMAQLPSQTEENGEDEINQGQITGYKSFESMLTDLLDEPRNNELVIQVYPGAGYPMAGMPAQNGEKPQAEDEEKDKEESGPGEPKEPEPPEPDEPPETEETVPENQEKGEQQPQEEPEIKSVSKTDFVLEGSFSLDVKIKQPQSEAEKSSQAEAKNNNKEEAESPKKADSGQQQQDANNQLKNGD